MFTYRSCKKISPQKKTTIDLYTFIEVTKNNKKYCPTGCKQDKQSDRFLFVKKYYTHTKRKDI